MSISLCQSRSVLGTWGHRGDFSPTPVRSSWRGPGWLYMVVALFCSIKWQSNSAGREIILQETVKGMNNTILDLLDSKKATLINLEKQGRGKTEPRLGVSRAELGQKNYQLAEKNKHLYAHHSAECFRSHLTVRVLKCIQPKRGKIKVES